MGSSASALSTTQTGDTSLHRNIAYLHIATSQLPSHLPWDIDVRCWYFTIKRPSEGMEMDIFFVHSGKIFGIEEVDRKIHGHDNKHLAEMFEPISLEATAT